MTDAAKELEQMAETLERDAKALLTLAVQEQKARRGLYDASSAAASASFENELRVKAASIEGCARRLRERATALRSSATEAA